MQENFRTRYAAARRAVVPFARVWEASLTAVKEEESSHE